MRLLDDNDAENKTKVKVKVTLVIDDFIFMFAFFIMFSILHVLDFIMLTNLLTTHN